MSYTMMQFDNDIPTTTSSDVYTQHDGIFTLRSLRLQGFRQATRWKANKEESKVVLHSDRKLATLSLIHHLIPLAGAVALIALNWRTIYIGSVSATVSTTLQFAAKFLEVLMQSSLTVILLDIIKRMVVSNEPIPLGSFLAPYRLTDLSFLWSLEYWGSATSVYPRNIRKVVVVLVVPAAFVLVALLGPSTAVAMIPRLIQAPVAQNLIFLGKTDVLYPTDFQTANGSIGNEASIVPSLYGLSSGQRLFGPASSLLRQSAVISDTQGTRMMRNAMNFTTDGWFWSTSTTIPTQGASFILQSEGTVGKSNTALMTARQPYVNGTCAMYLNGKKNESDLSSGYIQFSNTTKTLNSLVRYQDLFPAQQSNSTLDSDSPLAVLRGSTSDVSLGWYDASNVTHDNTLLMAYVEYGDSASEPGTDPINIVCLVNAWWAEARLNMTSESPVVDGNLQLYDPKHSPLASIKISPEWMKRAAILFLEANPTTVEMADISPGDAVIALALSNAAQLPCEDTQCLLQTRPLTLQPAFLMDNIASDYNSTLNAQQNASMTQFLQENGNSKKYSRIAIWPEDDWTDISSLSQFEIDHISVGYGYNSNAVPVQLSLAALWIYVVIVVAHTFYVLSIGHASTSWDSIGELIMLALNSRRPDYMKGTSVGVETMDPYKRPMNIRIGQEGSVEIVFADDPAAKDAGYSRVMYNERYL